MCQTQKHNRSYSVYTRDVPHRWSHVHHNATSVPNSPSGDLSSPQEGSCVRPLIPHAPPCCCPSALSFDAAVFDKGMRQRRDEPRQRQRGVCFSPSRCSFTFISTSTVLSKSKNSNPYTHGCIPVPHTHTQLHSGFNQKERQKHTHTCALAQICFHLSTRTL